jgi:hypothetical protein
MAIPIQFDPFNFALSATLIVIMLAELNFSRRERRRLREIQTAPA